MAVLETIRVKFGILITVIIAVALLGFIIDPTIILSWFNSGQEEVNVGTVNGEPVTYSEFSKELERLEGISQFMTNPDASAEDMQKYNNENAWNSVMYNKLIIPNIEKAGIAVGENEVIDIMSGDIPSPVINSVFSDGNGIFYKDALLQFVEMCNQDETGAYKSFWNYLSEEAKKQQYFGKYLSLMVNSGYMNTLMKENIISGTNNTFDLEFVSIPFGYERDTTIVVSDSEIADYYNSHKKFYKQVEGRDIEYVSFVTVPSDSDVAAAKAEIDELYGEFTETDDLSTFLFSNSDREYDEHWYASGELNAVSSKLNEFVSNNRKGAVSEIVKDGDAFYAARIIDQAMVSDSVFVKAINATEPDSLFNSVEAMWITQTPGYEKLMTLSKGSELTLNGLKFKLMDRTKPSMKKQVAILEKQVIPSEETIENYRAQANDLSAKAAGNYDNFKATVNEEGLYAHPVTRMLESSDNLGYIDNTKEVTRWAFESAAGQVSDVIAVDAVNFIVAAVTKVHNEGYTPLEEVSSQIREHLYAKKLAAKKVAEVSEKIAGVESLESIAKMFNTTVSSKDGVAFHSRDSYGTEPMLIGAASVAEVGKINKPVAGNYSVYVYKVTKNDAGEFFTESDADNYNMQKAQMETQMIIPTMAEAADVKDYRARYF